MTALSMEMECITHGWTRFRETYSQDKYGKYPRMRCVTCMTMTKRATERRNKATLVQEAGGACVLCGYDKCLSALHFHHVDPTTKSFQIGNCDRGLASLRKEADKCVLLCANCHMEVEVGATTLGLALAGAE